MSNEIKYTKQYSFGGDSNSTKYKPDTKQEIIEDILKIPAVTMKGHRDELIEYDLTLEEPICIWKKEYLEVMDQMSLGILRAFAERRKEFITKKY